MSELSLTWDDHHNTLVGVFETLLETSTLVDCTLAAEGQYLKAHKIILSACSPYFELLFKQENERNPIVVLKDIKFQELKAMIDFIYRGKVKVPEERLGDFVDAAESLQIKGLGGDNSKSPKHTKTENTVAQSQASRKSPPPRKRRRRSYVSDSEDDGGTSSPAPEIGYEKTALSGHPTSFLKVDSLKCSQNNLSATSVGVVDNLVSATSSAARSEPNMDKSESVYFSNSTITSSNKLAQPETVVKREPELVEPNDLFEPEMEFIETKEESIAENTILDSEEDTSEPTEPLNVNELSRSQFPTFPTNLQSTAGAESVFPPSVMPEVNRNQGPAVPELAAGCAETPSRGTRSADSDMDEDYVDGDGDGGDDSDCYSYVEPLVVYSSSPPPPPDQSSAEVEQELKQEEQVEEQSGDGGFETQHVQPHFLLDVAGAAAEAAEAAAAAAEDSAAKRSVCGVCHKGFPTPSTLNRHMRIHTGERPYLCRFCGKAFQQSGHLLLHLRRHTGEKPYDCEFCGKAFPQSSTLKLHLRCHTGERPFVCQVCGRAFHQKVHMLRHERSHARIKRPYRCEACGLVARRRRELEQHMRKTHHVNTHPIPEARPRARAQAETAARRC